MYRLVGFAVVAAAVYVSCYQPNFRDCEISCTALSGCPDGLSCDTGAGRCALNGVCGAPGDGPLGGYKDAPALDGSAACWTYTPTNYMPCMPGFPMPGDISGMSTINTAASACSYGNGDVCLYHVSNLDITSAIRVIGPRPLILVSDHDITVEAAITFDAAIGSGGAKCTAPAVPLATHIGAGGGGGGYGAPGAPGGAGSGVTSPTGGDMFGSGSLDPLFPGCPGADGGSGSGAAGGERGYGGGAIELSARGMVQLASGSLVSANGGGGAGGVGLGSGFFSGGGGGGAGGSILLEGSYVAVAGSVCAVGGGGGEGGFGTSIGVAGGAGSGCTRGSGTATGIGAGGNGGGSSAPGAGTNAGTMIAGGGGGGSIGRSRIHSIQTTNTGGATTVPPPVTP